MRRRAEINIGEEYGWLTVLSEAPKDSSGHLKYHVCCRCGAEFDVQTSVLLKRTSKCISCGQKHRKTIEKANIVGQTINNRYVLSETSKTKNGARRFYCKCLVCGDISVKTKSQLERAKTGHCANCRPNYNFVVDGNVAHGTLPDGTPFCIDAEDINRVSDHWWQLKKGYIISSDLNRLRLHCFLLNNPDAIIDHINRNRCDCRKSNLRFVTAQQNSMNKSLQKNSTTGYCGVCYLKGKKRFIATIGLNNKRVYLGSSEEAVICAQMYNIASILLFRDYVGHINIVPKPSDQLIQRIKAKCLPYMVQANLATQPCGFSISA